jgi:hypothetical protein
MDDEPRPFHYHRHEVVQTLLDHEDPRLRQRAASFIYRPVEELFAVHTDPGCWYNLVDAPEAQGTLNAMRQALQSDMKETGDPLLGEYRKLLAG